MQEKWKRIKAILESRNALSLFGLANGASLQEFTVLESEIGQELPENMKAFYSVHNGQHSGPGLFFGEKFLSIAEISEHWDAWLEYEDDNDEFADSMASEPDGYIKPMYANRHWIPLLHDYDGNFIGMDFDPDSKGRKGQIIAYGGHQDLKILKANDFAEFIDKYISQLLSLTWELDQGRWAIRNKEFNFNYNDWRWDATEKTELQSKIIPSDICYSVWVSDSEGKLPEEYFNTTFLQEFNISRDFNASIYAYRTGENLDDLYQDIMSEKYADALRNQLSKMGMKKIYYIYIAEDYDYNALASKKTKNDKFTFVGSFVVRR